MHPSPAMTVSRLALVRRGLLLNYDREQAEGRETIHS